MRMGRHFAAAAAACLAFAATAAGEVKTRVVDYTVSGAQLQGMIAWDDAVKTKRPGVLVVHEWWGHNEHARTQARKLAEAGYVAFALDLFGKGKVTTHPKEAEAFMKEALSNPGATAARFSSAVDLLKKEPNVDTNKIGVVGYCMGGSVAWLSATRIDGLSAAVGYYGGAVADFATERPRCPVLLHFGETDASIPKEHWDKIKAEFALNEGGYILQDKGGTVRQVNVTTVEKLSVTFRLKTKGPVGHSSRRLPPMQTANGRMIAALARLSEYDTSVKLVPEARAYFTALAKLNPGPLRSGIEKLLRANDARTQQEAEREKLRATLREELLRVAQPIISKIATEAGFDMVIARPQSALFVKAELDITPQVMAALDAQATA